jgi:GntR family transcriptional regulator
VRPAPSEKAPIDRDSPLPLYIQIKDWLLDRILSHHYEDRIDSEAAIAESWNVSRGTVQQAVDMLVRLDVLERRQGSGTYINANRRDKLYSEIPSFMQDLRAAGLEPVSRIQSVVTVRGTPDLTRPLELPDGAEVIVLRRLIETRLRPFALMVTALPRARFDQAAFEGVTGSLYALLRDVYRCTPCRVRDTIRAANAEGEVAEALRLARGTAVLRSERIGWDQAGEAFEFTCSYVQTLDLALSIGIERAAGMSERNEHDTAWRYRVGFGHLGGKGAADR